MSDGGLLFCVCLKERKYRHTTVQLNLQTCKVSFPDPGVFALLIKFVTWCGTIRVDTWELIAPHQPHHKCDGRIKDHCDHLKRDQSNTLFEGL